MLLFFLVWCFGHKAGGVSAPQPGIEPAPPALEGEVLTTGEPGRCQEYTILWVFLPPVLKNGLPLQLSPFLFPRTACISQFSHSVVSNISLWPHEPHHIWRPCPSPTPRVHPNPGPLSWWCHTTISCSAVPFSSCPQSFPASGSFQMSQLFTSGGQNIGVSASASVIPMNTQD